MGRHGYCLVPCRAHAKQGSHRAATGRCWTQVDLARTAVDDLTPVGHGRAREYPIAPPVRRQAVSPSDLRGGEPSERTAEGRRRLGQALRALLQHNKGSADLTTLEVI